MRSSLTAIATIFFLIFSVSTLFAKTWNITPNGTGDAPTIQAGIDSAVAGDIVLLSAGTYIGIGNRDIDFLGKAITVTSESGPELTIIDCQSLGRGFTFHMGEGPASVVTGLTIQNGSATYGGGIDCIFSSPTITNNTLTENVGTISGGGIFCGNWSSPNIRNNNITGNTGTNGGGGIWIDVASPTIESNTINGNSTDVLGGGIYCSFSSPMITGNTLSANSASFGGGIACSNSSSPTISSNTITANAAYSGGGIFCTGSSPTIEYTIVAFSSQGNGVHCQEGSYPTIACCDIYGNAGGNALCGISNGGNFFADPEFCGILGIYNLYLQSDSPCVPGNHPYGSSCGLIGALPVKCGSVMTEQKTWGEIKAIYHK